MKNFQVRYNVITSIHKQKSKHYTGKIQMRFTLLYAIFVETVQKIVVASCGTCNFHVGWISTEHDPRSS
jgi:hypothetical protein